MRNKWIVCTLILTLLIGPFAVKTSAAGGGGGCSGEDENQCLAVVFGTAAALILVVYLVSRHTGEKESVASGKQPLPHEALPVNYHVDTLAEKQFTASSFKTENQVTQNGDIILWKW
jgi:hypothetical protein